MSSTTPAVVATESKQQVEPMLDENEDRYVLFPIKYDRIWEFYKLHMASFWTAEEIDLSQDLTDWAELTADEQHFLKMVLAFFAGADGIVLENLAGRFIKEIQIPEARCFYGFQLAMENIHSETYSLLIDTYIKSETEKARLFNAAQEVPCVKKKADWAKQWIGSTSSFASRLVAFACVEGIFFSGSFCAIFYMKKRNKLPGLTFSNELISRDEGLHTDFAVLLYSMLENPLALDILENIVLEAVAIEKEFICDALPVSLIGMNKVLMAQYIEFVADRLWTKLTANYTDVTPKPHLFGSKNPFEFMEMISLQGKTNFFEKRVGEYQKSGIMSNLKKQQQQKKDRENGIEATSAQFGDDSDDGFDMDADF